MRISGDAWDAMTAAIMAPFALRDGLWISAHLSTVELDSRQFDAGDSEVWIDLDAFMALLGMLATPRPWIEGFEPRAFGRPVEEVNRIGRMILGAGWAGIGALTLCDPSGEGGLTLATASALEVYDGV
jgi:hypothetical protein